MLTSPFKASNCGTETQTHTELYSLWFTKALGKRPQGHYRLPVRQNMSTNGYHASCLSSHTLVCAHPCFLSSMVEDVGLYQLTAFGEIPLLQCSLKLRLYFLRSRSMLCQGMWFHHSLFSATPPSLPRLFL